MMALNCTKGLNKTRLLITVLHLNIIVLKCFCSYAIAMHYIVNIGQIETKLYIAVCTHITREA